MLISRVTCPNCRVAEGLLTKAGVAYEKHIAEEDLDLCRKYGVKGAPTLIITDGENFQSYYSVPEIKKYLASV
jgi:ribonucleoside-triphosphate reductase